MNFNNISDKIVFKFLTKIRYGQLKLINYDNREYFFGDKNEKLSVELKVNKPGFTFTIIKSGRDYIIEKLDQLKKEL